MYDGIFNLKYTKTVKGQYVAVNSKDGGWAIYGEDKNLLFASGSITEREISFDEGLAWAEIYGAVYADKKILELQLLLNVLGFRLQ